MFFAIGRAIEITPETRKKKLFLLMNACQMCFFSTQLKIAV